MPAGKLADTVAGHLGVKLEEKQKLLEEADVGERLEAIYGLMQGEMSRAQGREEDQDAASRRRWSGPSASTI